MNAFSPPFGPKATATVGMRPGTPTAQPAARPTAGANATSMRWAALADAGKVVAALAGVAPETLDARQRNLPILLRDCAPWRRQLADGAIADLAAVMEPGLAALLAVSARGADPRPAARALWREFAISRQAIVDLLPASGAMGPRRSA
jgi:hypothetical protein